MKKFALIYGVIATLLWLFLLVYLLIDFKDLAKDSHKITTNSSLAPFDKALQACINKHNTYLKKTPATWQGRKSRCELYAPS